MVEISLNTGEQEIAKQIGFARYAASRLAGVTDAKIGPQSEAETDIEGAAAELAFCKAANIFPDLDIGSYGDYDCFLGSATVDVKATKRPEGRLLVRPEKKEHPALYYALVVGQFPGPYRIAGIIHRNVMFQPENLKDLGYGPTYAMDQRDLQPFEDWLIEMQ